MVRDSSGRWGRWSDGGGSSLERVDAHAATDRADHAGVVEPSDGVTHGRVPERRLSDAVETDGREHDDHERCLGV